MFLLFLSFLFGIPIGITSSTVELKTCAITARTLSESVIKNNKKKHGKIALEVKYRRS